MLLSRFTRDEGFSMLRKGSNRLAGWLVVLALLAAVLVAWQAPAQAPDEPLSVADNSPHVPLKCLGVSSCTAAACHNAGGADGSKRSEYTTWFQHDRHAHAFAVLGEKQSEIIARNLAAGGKIVPAKENTLCLKCHALAPELAGKKKAYVNDDGVSCESCHGRAEKWLSIHYLPEWQQKSDEDKLHYGMTPTKNLAYRARQCAECHIGTPDKDVNHDLYAAGHPPLYYEFSAFLGSMPKHWSEGEDKARYPDLDFRAWAVGQVVSANAAMELLAHRASNKSTNPWPEFAEYNCSACHHSLRVAGASPSETYPADHKLGVLPWGSWFTPLLSKALTGRISKEELTGLDRDLAKLKREMESRFPNRDGVASRANSIAHRLNDLLSSEESGKYHHAVLPQSLGSLLDRRASTVSQRDWELATQQFLARQAFYRAMRDKDPRWQDPAERGTLEELRERLLIRAPFSTLKDTPTK
jgi:hypothetical protein